MHLSHPDAVPNRRLALGRVTLPALLIAIVGGVLTYGAIKYGPVYADYLKVKGLVSEAGQRAVMASREDAGRSWFDQRTSEEGLTWLSADSMLWERIDREHFDVGVRYEVQVEHLLLGADRVEFSYYCTATRTGCRKFVPEW